MLPLRIAGETRRLAEDQDEYFALSIKDSVLNGVDVMVSSWEPTPKEVEILFYEGGAFYVEYKFSPSKIVLAESRKPSVIERAGILAGGSVRLYVPGRIHPPVIVGVDATPRPSPNRLRAILTVKAPAPVA